MSFRISSEFCVGQQRCSVHPLRLSGCSAYSQMMRLFSFSRSADFSAPVSRARARPWAFSADCRQGACPQKRGVFGEHFGSHLRLFQWREVSIYCFVVPKHRGPPLLTVLYFILEYNLGLDCWYWEQSFWNRPTGCKIQGLSARLREKSLEDSRVCLSLEEKSQSGCLEGVHLSVYEEEHLSLTYCVQPLGELFLSTRRLGGKVLPV